MQGHIKTLKTLNFLLPISFNFASHNVIVDLDWSIGKSRSWSMSMKGLGPPRSSFSCLSVYLFIRMTVAWHQTHYNRCSINKKLVADNHLSGWQNIDFPISYIVLQWELQKEWSCGLEENCETCLYILLNEHFNGY